MIVRVPPTRSNGPCCSTRSSLACVSSGRSPISSRNSVPPSATSKRPSRRWKAPVKAPFSCPKSSLSTKPAGSAAQLTVISGRSRRALRACRARAIRSLPVPVSPHSSTVVSEGATRSTACITWRNAALVPTNSSAPVASLMHLAQGTELRFQRADLRLLLRQGFGLLLERVEQPPQLRLDVFHAVGGL